MTQEQIKRLVREANPVPDVAALEPLEVSFPKLDEQRRLDMPGNDRVEVDKGADEPRRGLLIGAGVAALILVVGLFAIQPWDRQEPVAQPATTTVTSAAEGAREVELSPAGDGPSSVLTLSMPEGWAWVDGWAVATDSEPDTNFVGYWYIGNVFGGRCDLNGELLDPAPGPTVDDLAAAFVEAWGSYASAPVDTNLGGYSGRKIVLTIPTPSDDCPEVNMNGWTEQGECCSANRWYSSHGQIEEIFILDVEGSRQVIAVRSEPETTSTRRVELQGILDSITIEMG